MSSRCFLCLFMIVGLSGQLSWAQDTKAEKKDSPKLAVKAPPMNVVPRTHADVHYGRHERQVVDFYQAKSDSPMLGLMLMETLNSTGVEGHIS